MRSSISISLWLYKTKWKTRQIKSLIKTVHISLCERKIILRKIFYAKILCFFYIPLQVQWNCLKMFTFLRELRRQDMQEQFCLRQKETLISSSWIWEKCKIIFQHFTCERTWKRSWRNKGKTHRFVYVLSRSFFMFASKTKVLFYFNEIKLF